jgi:Skp family chaperone for outer membrane proteins
MARKSLFSVVLGLLLVCSAGNGSWAGLGVNQKAVPADMIASEGNPQSSQESKEEYRKLEDELKRLLDELKRLEKNMEDKVQNEIIPFLRKEIEKIRERIRQFRMDEKPPESERPIRT